MSLQICSFLFEVITFTLLVLDCRGCSLATLFFAIQHASTLLESFFYVLSRSFDHHTRYCKALPP